jgi:hypothetical protein
MELDDALRALAATQYSVVARRQARALGATPSAMRNRLNGPDWELATPRVLRLVGAPRGIRQELMIAVLDAGPGAAVSHRAAAALWRLPGFGFDAMEVSLRRGVSGAASHAAIVHRPSLLPPSHVTERHGIPVTTLSRTLFDVAGGLRPGRLERVVDTVVAKSPATLLALRTVLAELGASGRPGVAAMRALLSERPDGYVATASGLEARFARILADAGEPPLSRQVDLGGHDWIGRVDFVDRARRIVVEVDSDVHHTSPLDRVHDRRRDDALLAAGWHQVIRVTEDAIWRRPDVAVSLVRDARRRHSAVPAPGIDRLRSIPGART